VNNVLEKEQAVRVARSVKGVRGVVDRISVKPAPRSDEEILKDVDQALLMNPATDSFEISVDVEDAAVTLSGNVGSWQEKRLAETVAKQVAGVAELRNNLTVDVVEVRSDLEIAQEIRELLRWDARVDDAMINVEVEEGNVTLSGVAGSALEKSRARRKSWVRGVRSVDATGVEVESWARDKRLREDKYTSVTDEEIREAVEDAFLYDPRVSLLNPEVEVSNGIVTLSGTVEDLWAKQAAAEDARNVVGVFRVKNHLKVRPAIPIEDDEIRQNVENSLLLDPYLDRFEIETAVINGQVYLWGDVESTFQRSRAEYLTAQVPGVIDVQNRLVVQVDEDLKSDWEIRTDIRNELFWSPFVDADQVTVSVVNGIASLHGTVDTWSEWQAAEENALEGGAISVDNDLEVREGGPEEHTPSESDESWWSWWSSEVPS
jgi:osmotically-inducible protein OsmY